MNAVNQDLNDQEKQTKGNFHLGWKSSDRKWQVKGRKGIPDLEVLWNKDVYVCIAGQVLWKDVHVYVDLVDNEQNEI